MGIPGSNTEGIDRTVAVALDDGEYVAVIEDLLPGRYHISTDATVDRRLRITNNTDDLLANRPFTIRFRGDTYADAVLDETTTVDFPIEPEPARVRGRLLVADGLESRADGLKTAAYRPRQQDGIAFRASSYHQDALPASADAVAVESRDDATFELLIVPGIYGTTIDGMDDYWGSHVHRIIAEPDGTTSSRYYSGWPAHGPWNLPRSSSTTGIYSAGGLPYSSGHTYDTEWFVHIDRCRIQGNVSRGLTPFDWIIAVDPEREGLSRYRTINYNHLTATGGRVRITSEHGVAHAPVTQNAPGNHLFLSPDLHPPGTYTVALDHPDLVGQRTFTETYNDWPPPGQVPDFELSFSLARPLNSLRYFQHLQYDIPEAGALEITNMVWNEAESRYDDLGTITPTFARIPAFGGRIMRGGARQPYPGTSVVYWQDNANDDNWFTLPVDSANPVLYSGGPQATPSLPRPELRHRVRVKTIDVHNPATEVTGVQVTFDGNALPNTTPVTVQRTAELLSLKIVDGEPAVTHPTYRYFGVTGQGYTPADISDPLNPLFDYTVLMQRGLRVRGTVRNALAVDGSNEPVPGAKLRIFAPSGRRSIHQSAFTTAADGTYTTHAFHENQTMYVRVEAHGYAPQRIRLTPDLATEVAGAEDAGTFEHVLDISLTPLTQPQFDLDNTALDRFGAFLPGVYRSGDGNAFTAATAENDLTLSWTATATAPSQTFTFDNFEPAGGGPPSPPTVTETYDDPITAVYLIDQRSFTGNPLAVDPTPRDLPDPRNPHLVHDYLDRLERGQFPHTRFQKITAFDPQPTQGSFKADGQLPLWKFHPGELRFAVVALTARGAVQTLQNARFDRSPSGDPVPVDGFGDALQRLYGIPAPQWLATSLDAIALIADKQPTAEALARAINLGNFTPAPQFTAEIKVGDGGDDGPLGFLSYDYTSQYGFSLGLDMPGGDVASLAPGFLGIDATLNGGFSVDGEAHTATFGVSSSLAAPDLPVPAPKKSKYVPKFIRKAAKSVAKLAPEVTLNLNGGVSVTNDFGAPETAGPPAPSVSTANNVGGDLTAEISQDYTTVLLAIPKIGAVLFAVAKENDIEVKTRASGSIGIGVEREWHNPAPVDTDFSLAPLSDFLYGEDPTVQDLSLCLNLTVGAAIGAGDRFGASADLALTAVGDGGNDCFEDGSPSASITFNTVGNPILKSVQGAVAVDLKVFIDAWFARYEKQLKVDLLTFKHEFNTTPLYDIAPLDIKNTTVTRDGFPPAAFLGDPVLLDDLLPLGNFSTATAADGTTFVLAIGVSPDGGAFVLQLLRRAPDGTWSDPVEIADAPGIVSTALAPLPDGSFLAAWTEVSEENLTNPFPPSTVRSLGLGADGTPDATPLTVAELDDVAATLALQPLSADRVALLALTTAGGATSQDFAVDASVLDAGTWGTLTNLRPTSRITAFRAASDGTAVQVATVGGDGDLTTLSFDGTAATPGVVMATGAATALDLVHDGNHFLLAHAVDAAAGIRLHTSADGATWTSLDTDLLAATPASLAAAPVAGQLLLAWTQGGSSTAVHTATIDPSDGTTTAGPAVATPFSPAFYSDLDLSPNPDGSASLFARHTGAADQLRHFLINPDLSNSDLDLDGLPDAAELAIADADPDDAIVLPADVLPDADFDGDGTSNRDEILAGTDPTSAPSGPAPQADSDGDGLPDAWELANFGSPTAADPDADPDADRSTNLDEYIANTDPNDPTSTFAVTAVTILPDGAATLTIPTAPGRVYTLEASDDLRSFTPVSPPTPGTGADLSLSDPTAPAPPSRQYRVTVQLASP